MPFLFENLLVYQKALNFADEVCQLSSRFNRGFGFLADQLNRASLSISTNLAEGTVASPQPTAATSSRSLAARSKDVYRYWNSPAAADKSPMPSICSSKLVSRKYLGCFPG